MIGQSIIAISEAYLNKQEIQPNMGFQDPVMQREMETYTTWQKGDPWCADLAILIWTKAYTPFPAMLRWCKKWFSGNSQQMGRNAHADPVWPTSTTTPQLGAMVIFGDVGSTTSGHTAACVVSIDPDGIHYTAREGNTIPPGNPGHEAEGYTVADHVHVIGAPHPVTGLAFIRFILPVEPGTLTEK